MSIWSVCQPILRKQNFEQEGWWSRYFKCMSIYRLCLLKVHVNLHTHWLRQKTLKMILKCMSIWGACLPTVYIYIECTMYILYTLDTFVRTLWDTKSAYPKHLRTRQQVWIFMFYVRCHYTLIFFIRTHL